MKTYAQVGAFAGAVLLTVTVAARAGAPAEDADTILARARRRLSASRTYQATIMTHTTVGRGAATTSRLTVRLQTGRRAYVRIEPMGVEFWHDGKSLTRLDRRAGVYSRLRADSSTPPLTPQDYVGLARGGTCHRIRTETTAGRRVDVLLLARSGAGQKAQLRTTTMLHVDPKTYRVLSYKTTSPGPEGEDDGAPAQIATRGEIVREIIDAPIPDSTFVFRAPRGARLESSGGTR